MRGKCKAFFALEGKFQPTCSCNGCWDYWFRTNKSKYFAARKALDEMGEETVGQGQRIMLERQFPEPRPSEVDTFIDQQVGRFVKQVKRYVREDEKAEA